MPSLISNQKTSRANAPSVAEIQDTSPLRDQDLPKIDKYEEAIKIGSDPVNQRHGIESQSRTEPTRLDTKAPQKSAEYQKAEKNSAQPPPETVPWYKRAWNSVISSATKATTELKEIVKEVAPQVEAVAKAALVKVVDAFSTKEKAMETLKSCAKYGLSLASETIKGMGITDIVGGIIDLNPLKTLKGVVTGVGEISGISDVIMAAKYALQGEWKMAGVHAGFAILSAGSIAATIATAGALGGSVLGITVLKQGLKQSVKAMAKEGFETLAKEVTSEVVQKTIKTLGKDGAQVLEQNLMKAGEEIAKKTLNTLDKAITEKGVQAITHDAVKKVTSAYASEITEKTLKKLGVVGFIEDGTQKVLKSVSTDSSREIAEKLIKNGLDSSKAFKTAQFMKTALNSKAVDGMIKNSMEQGITSTLRHEFGRKIEVGFARSFEEGVEKLGEKHALTSAKKELIEKAGKEGFEQGLEKGIRTVVREGIEKAFKQFRGAATDAGASFTVRNEDEDWTARKPAYEDVRRKVEPEDVRVNKRKQAEEIKLRKKIDD